MSVPHVPTNLFATPGARFLFSSDTCSCTPHAARHSVGLLCIVYLCSLSTALTSSIYDYVSLIVVKHSRL